jgi:hypothetical protein
MPLPAFRGFENDTIRNKTVKHELSVSLRDPIRRSVGEVTEYMKKSILNHLTASVDWNIDPYSLLYYGLVNDSLEKCRLKLSTGTASFLI